MPRFFEDWLKLLRMRNLLSKIAHQSLLEIEFPESLKKQ